MGKRGPAKKPQQLKDLEGNPGKRARNKSAPKPTGHAEAPDWMSDYAREVWDRAVSAMPPALYSGADVPLLTAYCEAVDLHRRAVEAVRDEGEISKGEKGTPFQNPWVSIQNKQAALIASLGSRLGLDPSSRQDINAPVDDRPKSKFEGLIGLPGGRERAA